VTARDPRKDPRPGDVVDLDGVLSLVEKVDACGIVHVWQTAVGMKCGTWAFLGDEWQEVFSAAEVRRVAP
jgi:hypothetical protein